MIQNFEARGGPEYGRKNLPKLRDTLKKLKLDSPKSDLNLDKRVW